MENRDRPTYKCSEEQIHPVGLGVALPNLRGPIEPLLTNCFTKLNISVTLIKDSQTTFRRYIMRSGMQMDEAGKLNVFAVEPKMYVSEDSQFGFNVNSERLNGRMAMIGFVSLLIMEVVTGHGLVGFFTSL
jgi:hypothetical protein